MFTAFSNQLNCKFMKPGNRPYDRNSKQWQTMETVNPCNDFIVEFLVRSKIKVDKQGLNQYYCYNLAIESVKKYPLPILCASQLAVIQGFGDFFKTETMKLIKKHYDRNRLPTPEEKKEDEAQQNQSLRLNIKKINSKKVQKRNKRAFRSDSQDLDEYENPEVPEDINMFESQLQSRFESNFSKMSSKSSKSSKNISMQSQTSQGSQSSRVYKPKPGTQPFLILQIMKNLNAHKKPITKGEINEYLYDKAQEKMKLWHLTRSKLRDHGFIKVDDEDSDFLHLTQKGLIYADSLIIQNQQTPSKAKKQESNEKKSKQPYCKTLKKNLVPPPLNYKDLNLLINMSNLQQEQKQTINAHFSAVKGFKFRFQQMDVCSFIWQIQDNILDVVIARIKLSQFNQDAFKNLIYCLKATESKEIILFLEMSDQEAEKKANQEKQKMQIYLSKAKVTKIKTFKTKSLKQTLIGMEKIRKMLLEILKNIISGSQIYSLGTLNDFNDRNQKKNPLTMRNLFITALRCFPCISIRNIQGIVEKFPCFKSMYDKISELEDQNERVQFLQWLLANHGPQRGINRMIVDFLFLPEYVDQV